MNKRLLLIFITLSFVTSVAKLSAFNSDTTVVAKPKTVKVPRHYFSNSIFLDYYTIGKRDLDTVNLVSKKLHSYQLSQVTLGFNIPV